jgi:hypothetical protein
MVEVEVVIDLIESPSQSVNHLIALTLEAFQSLDHRSRFIGKRRPAHVLVD